MLNTETTPNFSLISPFKANDFLVKSAWKNSFFERKQVRVLVGSSGELSIQTVAQNIFARIVSQILSVLSCGRIKSFGKSVESQVSQVYALPENLPVPLNAEQQKKIFDLQCNLLIRVFLPSFQNLNELIPALEECVIAENFDEEIMNRFISMRTDILELHAFLQKEFLRDIQPHELHELYQTFEMQAQEMCENYPKELKKFIAEKKERDQEAFAITPNSDEISAIDTEIIAEKEGTVPSGIEQPIVEAPKQTTSKEQLLDLIAHATQYIDTLESNLQFSSAEWLKQELHSTVKTLSEAGESPSTIKKAIESLEDALDYTPENMTLVDQLMDLPIDSPHEQQIKDAVIANIKQTVAIFLKDLETKQQDVEGLIKNSPSSPWHKTLNEFFDSKRSNLEELTTHYTSTSFFTSATNEKIAIESLNKRELAEHKRHIDNYCSSVLKDLEKETNRAEIQNQRLRYEEWKALIPTYRPVLIENAQYYPLALIEDLIDKQTEILENTSKALIDAKSTRNYRDKLKSAADQLETLFKNIENYQNMHSIDQLESLQKLSSPYYSDLHDYIVNKAKEQLNAYKIVLGNYADMLSIYIPVLKEKGNCVETLEALETKVYSKISEAEALTVDYAVRLHFWDLLPKAVELNDLSPDNLNNYLMTIKEVINTGMQEVVQDAAKIGMSLKP